jgi:hypothetical protein
MSADFKNYNLCLFNSISDNPRVVEFGSKKSEIIDQVLDYYNLQKHTMSVLFVGFNPAILLADDFKRVGVTNIDGATFDWLQEDSGMNANAIEYVDFDSITSTSVSWDLVVAVDEFFTYAESDDHQKALIAKICGVAGKLVISTLKDYKNLDFKEKEFSQPAILRIDDTFKVFTEFHNWNFKDRSCWTTSVYVNGDSSESYGPYNRKTMYFKQLAKFSIDAGATSFLVHKNLMFKGLIKKNYEHVVSIRFNDEYR